MIAEPRRVRKLARRRIKINRITIENPLRFDLPDKTLFIKGVETVIEQENYKNRYSISVIFVDNAFIINLNKRYFAKTSVTDVISFNYEEEFLEGEIYISFEQALRQADEHSCELREELLRLTIHGTLHLLNYEDYSPADRQKMSQLEDKYLNFYFKSIS
ncbi:rRNA maturation RNase YbeY [candidate division KSB1 bacterium]|nr:rRNA maturation RNase YbeY [candidate division KSB1 bacterium]